MHPHQQEAISVMLSTILTLKDTVLIMVNEISDSNKMCRILQPMTQNCGTSPYVLKCEYPPPPGIRLSFMISVCWEQIRFSRLIFRGH